MPNHRSRRSLKLDWAIYLEEIEKDIFGEGRHSPKELAPAVAPGLAGDHRLAVEDAAFLSVLQKTKHPKWAAREEAARALGAFDQPAAHDALIRLLKDENHAVRRAAINSLAGFRRGALRPLLEELTRDFQSSCFCKAAQHILGVLDERGELTSEELRVLHTLKNTRYGLTVAIAANAALIAALAVSAAI